MKEQLTMRRRQGVGIRLSKEWILYARKPWFPPEGRDGISIVPTLTGKEQPKHDFLYWEFHGKNADQTLQAVRMSDWKGVRLKAGKDAEAPIQLFNLDKDVGETKNVAAKHPEVVERIAKLMIAAYTPSKIFPFERQK